MSCQFSHSFLSHSVFRWVLQGASLHWGVRLWMSRRPDRTELPSRFVSAGCFNTSDVPTSLFFRGWLFQQTPLVMVNMIRHYSLVDWQTWHLPMIPQPFRDDSPSPVPPYKYPVQRVPDPSILDLEISPVSTIYNANFQTSYHWSQSFSKDMLGMSQHRFSMTHHSTEGLCSFLKQTCVRFVAVGPQVAQFLTPLETRCFINVDTICEAIQKLPQLL